MVSVLVAESMIAENKNMYEETIEKMTEFHNKIINSMKHNSLLKGVLSIHNSHFDFGQVTPFFSNGIQLFTGDEVEFRSGKKGVIVKKGDTYYVYTNAETATLTSKKRMSELEDTFFDFEGYVTGDRLTITKHFNELALGEEIAKGRKGASGFIVDKVWRED